tara:strand:+ start:3814 stop:4578 length:765 start_codon:yes stop_codon:yes gene_type:complete
MLIKYSKYNSAGNNFILINCINQKINFLKILNLIIANPLVRESDGLLFISNSKKYNFNLSFYNPDGSNSFCGNGSLCALYHLKENDFISKEASFTSFGQKYTAEINDHITLKLKDIDDFKRLKNGYFINSGAPHHVKFVDEADNFNIENEASLIRGLPFYKINDCNFNLVSRLNNNSVYVRTFEKGVERETLSCGTGAVASVIAYALEKNKIINRVITKGGELNVYFEIKNSIKFSKIFLRGNPKYEYTDEILL